MANPVVDLVRTLARAFGMGGSDVGRRTDAAQENGAETLVPPAPAGEAQGMNTVLFVLLRRMHSPLIALICVYAVSILGFVLIPGLDDQGRPWRMDFFHAFYFVSFMSTTIGFGEVPYAFTEAQRAWATVTLYATVIAWLYAIGAVFALIRDPGVHELLRQARFRRAIRRIAEPFYLVCGYGDTGSLLVRAMSEACMRAVVIDIQADRVHALELEDLRLPMVGLCADAAQPDALLMAGLTHPCCAGVVALTNQDPVNLKVAITSKLLNPDLPVIARAETHDAGANMDSFGTDHIINPFDTFAGRLALALHSPSMFLLYEWMTAVPDEPLGEPLFAPRGHWVLCGYGRFGKAVHERLQAEGIAVTIVEANPEETGVPEGAVIGRGTEADTLQEAHIQEAVGIVAGTDDDTNNLSILMTARALNPELFMVARQSQQENNPIFDAARIDLIMRRGSIIARKIFAIITTPLLADFLLLARRKGDDWANQLISRIGGLTGEQAPHLWTVEATAQSAPALSGALTAGQTVTLGELLRDPRNREEILPCLVLLVRRGREFHLVPEEGFRLHPGDQLLFCSPAGVQGHVEWLVGNHNVLHYALTGEEHPSSYLWRWFTGRKGAEAS